MKEIYFVILILFLVSCGSSKIEGEKKSEDISGKILSNTIRTEKIYSINKKDSSLFKIDYEFFNQAKFPWQDSVNKCISNLILNKLQEKDEEYSKDTINQLFFKQQLELFYSEALSEYYKMEYKTLWKFELEIDVKDDFSNFISIYSNSKIYKGENETEYHNEWIHFSKNNVKKLNVSDFYFVDGNFINLIKDQFYIAFNLNKNMELTEFGYWFDETGFKLANNFYFENDSLHFVYNPYEIAPYSFGTIKLSVPLTLTNTFNKMDLSKN